MHVGYGLRIERVSPCLLLAEFDEKKKKKLKTRSCASDGKIIVLLFLSWRLLLSPSPDGSAQV